ncbi:CBS domain-containing protein [Neoroseomonas oryzicola]|uniref:CBS domain-containing protein n=1 Tax=Neoroseomonas oryzicola TaxID=535904 RepID=A0A9X9WJ58_9PROT|nr:CBS domain-containing protein [Neoroseomonas oryzicola]MBR0660368.1 CBS domain-containing protein [Neoroseomonas oryzicola]NKE18344.1 CBS domain-containing protein [Neoroseomonas oryzicola]
MTIQSILRHKGGDVFSVGPGEDATSIAQALAQHRIGAALVRDQDGAVLGIVSERDIVRAVAREGTTALARTARDLMTADLVTAAPSTSVAEALGLMTNHRCRHLPVMDHGRLAGMVSIGDLVKARIAQAEEEAESLRAFVTAA